MAVGVKEQFIKLIEDRNKNATDIIGRTPTKSKENPDKNVRPIPIVGLTFFNQYEKIERNYKYERSN